MLFTSCLRRAFVAASLSFVLAGGQASFAGSLDESFKNPPPSFGPWTWWHWNNGNISKEGVKADLQAMRDAGVVGAQIFDVGMGSPQGKVRFMDQEWMACFRLALEEGERLGVEIGVHNCPGWSSSGGPWIKPQDSMKILVASETQASGPSKFSGPLSKPDPKTGLYEDVAVFAVKSPPLRLTPVKAESEAPGFDAEALQSGAKGYSLRLAQGSESFVVFDFGAQVSPRTLFIRFTERNVQFKGEIFASSDGVAYKSLRAVELINHADTGSLKGFSLDSQGDAPAARFFKIALRPYKNPAFPHIKESGISVLWLSPRQTIEASEAKSGGGGSYSFPQRVQGQAASSEEPSTLDLSPLLKPSGDLEWSVPEGDWTILRVGYASTGKQCGPARESARGLECDKLDPKALDAHWKGMIEPLLKEASGLRSFTNVLIDSYEVGGQNWTPGIVERFKASYGYDPLPYLPSIFGIPVVSRERSERFLYDWRTNASDMMCESYFGHFSKLSSDAGLLSAVEPYYGHFDFIAAGKAAAIPMGEFWGGGASGTADSCRLAASVAHVYGHEIVAAESFTVDDTALGGGWRETPFSLKKYGDRQFCAGVNRIVLHSTIHQPLIDPRAKPGLTLERFGSHFGRNQTWQPFAKAWTEYLARCQLMLRQGLFQADLCVFPGENSPNRNVFKEPKAAGYDYDVCDRGALLSGLSVKDGLLTLPSGMSYRLLYVKDSSLMSLEVAKALERLVSEGARVCASKPLRTPGLSGFPNADRELASIADRLWGASPSARGSAKIGKGLLLWGISEADALAESGVSPDFSVDSKQRLDVDWLHRSAKGAEIYFLSNQSGAQASFNARFRVSGLAPELWNPETGSVEPCALYSFSEGFCSLPLTLPEAGSIFVVFKEKPGSQAVPSSLSFKPAKQPVGAPAPKGALEIKRAFYGGQDGKGRDVTELLASLVEDSSLCVSVSNGSFGGDPAPGVVKTLSVEYVLDGVKSEKSLSEGSSLNLASKKALGSAGACRLVKDAAGRLCAAFSCDGVAELSFPSGRSAKVECAGLPKPLAIEGPWRVSFPPALGAPDSIALESLAPLTESSDPGVRGFSGIATYSVDFEIPESFVSGQGRSFSLCLGDIGEGCVAKASLNGVDLGVAWAAPFALDASKALKPGRNSLSVKLATPWACRLIADEAFPEDCQRGGANLSAYPQWLLDGSPRPGQRISFVACKTFSKDSKPPRAGLQGPVALRPCLSLPVPDGK